MAYKPRILDVVELRVVTFDPTAPSQVGINVVHFEVTNVSNLGTNQAQFAIQVDNAIATLYKAAMSSSVNYRGVMVQKIWPLPRVVAESTIVNAGAASGAATQVPTQVAGLISLRTANAGRPFRGRIYMPFLGTGSIGAGGNPTAPYVTAIQNVANALFATFSVVSGGDSTTYTPVIYHAKGYGKPPANLHSVDVITSASASPLAATIRRRGNYGRTNSTSPI
jgi:hypothetical protein